MKKIILSSLILGVTLATTGVVIAKKSNVEQQPANIQFAKERGEKLGLLENAEEVAPGVFYLGKSMHKGKAVEGYAFVHYAKDSDKAKKSKPVRDDTYDKYKFLLPSLRLKWADTMTYEVDTEGDSFVGSGDLMTILGDSLETWDEKTSSDIFNSLATLAVDAEPGENDEHNIIVWRDLGSGGTIAYNSLWFDPVSMEIIDSDVVFNSYYDWADCDATEASCADAMDLQNIATHEFGHNGLGDLYMRPSAELTMHGYSNYGETKKRDLGTGDISGIQELYGTPTE